MQCVRLFLLIAAAALPLLVAVPCRAQNEPQTLVIGGERLMTLRTVDTVNRRRMTIQDRIDLVQDVFPKYLGGRFGRITSRPVGNRVHFYLNGDFFLACSPADAHVNGYRSAAQLARIWRPMLQRAFDASTARK